MTHESRSELRSEPCLRCKSSAPLTSTPRDETFLYTARMSVDASRGRVETDADRRPRGRLCESCTRAIAEWLEGGVRRVRCDSCDPSFHCFADPASCCKRPPGMTWRSLRSALDAHAVVGGRIGALDRVVVVRLDVDGRSLVGQLRAVTTDVGDAGDPSLVMDGGDVAVDPGLDLTCDHCGTRRATCFGRYEDPGQPELACDACCGHGGEDGWCRPVRELWAWVLQLYARGQGSAMEAAPALPGAANSSPPFASGVLTYDELVVAARNVGVDLTCGECAAMFYTGCPSSPGHPVAHDPSCRTEGVHGSAERHRGDRS